MGRALVTRYWECVRVHANSPYLCVSAQVSTRYPPLHFRAGVLCCGWAVWLNQGCRCTPCWFNQLIWIIQTRYSHDGLLLHWERGRLQENCSILRSIIRIVVSHCRSRAGPWWLLTRDVFSSQHWFEVITTLSKRVRLDGWLGLGWLLFQGVVPRH